MDQSSPWEASSLSLPKGPLLMGTKGSLQESATDPCPESG
jgi:hypothetical protein